MGAAVHGGLIRGFRIPALLGAAALAACGGGGGSGGPPTAPGPTSGELLVVLDRADGWPAPDVIVQILPLGRTATTDEAGEARFEDVPAGEYVVRATDLEGEPVERAVSFDPPAATVTLTLPALPAGIRIEWSGAVVDWGDPSRLRSRVGGADPAAVTWVSLDDAYLGEPVEMGRGPTTPVAPLRPGTTRVEARVVAPDGTVHRDVVEVEVRYRMAWNVALVGEVSYPPRSADVWVVGDVALLARRTAGGVAIVSLDGTVREVGRYEAPGSTTVDVKGAGRVAYVGHDEAVEAAGRGAITVLDVSDPSAPAVLAEIPPEEAPSSHNLWLEGDRLYAAALGFRYWDVSDPSAPRLLGERRVPGSPHDVHVRDGFAYAALQPSGGVNAAGGRLMFARDDLFPLAFEGWPGARTHSSWLHEDGVHLYVADEVPNAPIRIYDVSVPDAPREVARYRPRLGATPHNFQVMDERIALLSHYEHGIEVVDVSDPIEPRLIGFYDTRAGADDVDEGSGIHGAFGVHWSESGTIAVGDIDRGLIALRYTGP